MTKMDLNLIISIFLGVLAIIVTYLLYLKARKVKKLKYLVNNSIIIDHTSANIDKLQLLYEGKDITKAGVAYITISNAGNTEIDKSDVDDSDVLRITINSKNKILHQKIISSSNKSIRIAKESDITLLVNFNFLNPKDRFQLKIIHDGTPDESIELKGKIKGINQFYRVEHEIIDRYTIENIIDKAILLLLMYVAITVLFLFYLFTVQLDYKMMLFTVAYYLLLIFLFPLFVYRDEVLSHIKLTYKTFVSLFNLR